MGGVTIRGGVHDAQAARVPTRTKRQVYSHCTRVHSKRVLKSGWVGLVMRVFIAAIDMACLCLNRFGAGPWTLEDEALLERYV